MNQIQGKNKIKTKKSDAVLSNNTTSNRIETYKSLIPSFTISANNLQVERTSLEISKSDSKNKKNTHTPIKVSHLINKDNYFSVKEILPIQKSNDKNSFLLLKDDTENIITDGNSEYKTKGEEIFDSICEISKIEEISFMVPNYQRESLKIAENSLLSKANIKPKPVKDMLRGSVVKNKKLHNE